MRTSGGQLAVHVMHFVRVLRGAGLRVGPAAVLDALRVLDLVDLAAREDVRAALRAVLVHRHEDLALFEAAFTVFFRDPFGADQAMALLLSHTQVPPAQKSPLPRRLSEALHPRGRQAPNTPPKPVEVELELQLSWSEAAALRTRDFAEMSAEELAQARQLLGRLGVVRQRLPRRRYETTRRHTLVDPRATLRASLRGGGRDLPLRYRQRKREAPPLVLLCDISGSMSRYAEMMLRFMHLLTVADGRTQSFLFGTELFCVTRRLRHRDPDQALAQLGKTIADWGGGTRIGACLQTFNRVWARRVLGQGAVMLLMTDGLDRDPSEALAREAARLHRLCRHLIWLNPLLGYEGFVPRAQGIRALLAHVDEFRPVHNLESLEQLAQALAQAAPAIARRLAKPPTRNGKRA